MPLRPKFGPNHAAVEAFLRSLDDVPWFRVGRWPVGCEGDRPDGRSILW